MTAARLEARPRTDATLARAVADGVRAGLLASPKYLPSWLFYDQEGSRLFEQITELPEYYLTRTEQAILHAHAGDMIEAAGTPISLFELGAGSAYKTTILVSALLERQRSVIYTPVDVSASALTSAVHRMRASFPFIDVRPVVARYPDQLEWLRTVRGRRLLVFLGSSIGNFDAAAAGAFLHKLHGRLEEGDALLVGTDLRKPAPLLLDAYDDAAGVTARFNKNVLVRINRELGGQFDPDAFRHVVCWNAVASRIDMYLESLAHQSVLVEGLGMRLHFVAGERLHTESCYKYTAPMVERLLAAGGFAREASWVDERGWFAVHLAGVRPRS